MHRAAQGLVANQIIEVDAWTVTAFLGRVADPQGAAEPFHEPGFRAILFTDVANSTSIAHQLGDGAAFRLLTLHNTIIRRALCDLGGREVDKAGDGFFACFSSVSKAIDCAIEIQRSLTELNAGDSPAPIRVRIGLGAGEPVADGDALFGSTINQTARICAEAQPGQILVASVVRDLCLGKRYAFRDYGEVQLKGFPDPVRLHEVEWRP